MSTLETRELKKEIRKVNKQKRAEKKAIFLIGTLFPNRKTSARASKRTKNRIPVTHHACMLARLTMLSIHPIRKNL